MERDTFLQDFGDVLARSGLKQYADRGETFFALAAHLIRFNGVHNVTAITEPHQIIFRHFADCLTAASYLPEGARVIDVGCGGGFPCLPLAIARPDLQITALDSTAKKLKFVESAAAELGLNGVTVLCARAEEAVRRPDMRERFDVATARAVARLRILSELCLPFVRVGGTFLSLKGEAGAEEAREAERGIGILGGDLEWVREIPITDGGEILHHVLIRVKKVAHTPEIYPRNYAGIVKKPL